MHASTFLKLVIAAISDLYFWRFYLWKYHEPENLVNIVSYEYYKFNECEEINLFTFTARILPFCRLCIAPKYDVFHCPQVLCLSLVSCNRSSKGKEGRNTSHSPCNLVRTLSCHELTSMSYDSLHSCSSRSSCHHCSISFTPTLPHILSMVRSQEPIQCSFFFVLL